MNSLLRISLVALFVAGFASADTIELMNGNKVEGEVLATDAAAKTVTIEATIGGQLIQRSLPQAQVHALTVNGQRTVLTAKPGAAATAATTTRTPAEVQALIEQAGATPADWMKSTKLNFPQTLDLSWAPPPPNNKWNNQINVGQFVWDIINPNESRWREGIKFMEHVLDVNQANSEIRERATMELANMYFRFFQDYARAAYWWQKAGVTEQEDAASVFLAECYWRLGNKQMALDLMQDPDGYLNSIKLLGDMGEIDKSIAMAERYIAGTREPQWPLLLVADACRLAGRNEQAITYFQQVLDAPQDPNNKNRFQRLNNRARDSIEAIKLFDLLNLEKVADGTYNASALGYEGEVHVAVQVRSRRIESVKVTKHKEKQYYSSMRDVPEQIIAKQGVKGVDATSRATITGNAIINATAKALAEGAQ